MTVGYLKLIKVESNVNLKGFLILLPIFLLFLVPPIGSTDVFFYKALSQVANPFTEIAIKTNPFISLGSLIQIKYVMYAPLWITINHLLFEPITNLLTAMFSYKLLTTVFHLLNFKLIIKTLKLLNTKNYKLHALLYLLNPLLLFEFVVNAHFDVIMLTFILLGIYFFVSEKYELGFLSLTLSVLIKYTAIFTIPIFALYLLTRSKLSWVIRIKRLTISGVFSLITAILTFKPYWIGTTIFEGINRQSDWAVNSLFSALYTPIYLLYKELTGNNIYSRSFRDLWIVMGIIFLLLILKPAIRLFKALIYPKLKSDVSIHYFIYFSTLFYFLWIIFIQRSFWPWYVSWPLVFLPFIYREYKTLSSTILILSLTSLFFYLLQVFLGPWNVKPLSWPQVVVVLVIFIPALGRYMVTTRKGYR